MARCVFCCVLGQVVQWFAERSDLILLVFDAYKLDMGQEFREVMRVIAKHGDRVNKSIARAVSRQR